jgi:hypothetical protein
MEATRYLAAIVSFGMLTAGLPAQGGQQSNHAQVSVQMVGTFDLETTRGDDAQRMADEATRELPPGQRDRVHQSLLSRLQAPTKLAIERIGPTITIASSNAPRITFEADGRTRNEQGPDGRMMATHAEFQGDKLAVSSKGNRNTDFLVTFEPINNGDGLLVTRQMDSDDLPRSVTTRSYYRRVAAAPKWDLYAPESGYTPSAPQAPGAFVLPAGTHLTAVLTTLLSTRTSHSGDAFSMTVHGPAEYRDARIDGVVDSVTPYGDGRSAEIRVSFRTIRLRNGQVAECDAVLSSVRTPTGVDFRVTADAPAPAVGAAVGAIIGAAGTAVSAKGGAILAHDREQFLDLPPNTEVAIIVTSGRIR